MKKLFLLNRRKNTAASLPQTIPSLLLENVAGASYAYSLRKISGAYSGAAIRVRRSSDNSELDINFLADNSLDTTSLVDFVEANNGFITKFYNQVSLGFNASQTNSSLQPRIINSGSLIIGANSKPTISFNGSYLDAPGTSLMSTDLHHWFIVGKTNTPSITQFYYRALYSTNNALFGTYVHTTSRLISMARTAALGAKNSVSTNYSNTLYRLIGGFWKSDNTITNFINALNGTPATLADAAATTCVKITIGGDVDATVPLNGEICEFIHYPKELTTSEITNLQDNIRIFYNLW